MVPCFRMADDDLARDGLDRMADVLGRFGKPCNCQFALRPTSLNFSMCFLLVNPDFGANPLRDWLVVIHACASRAVLRPGAVGMTNSRPVPHLTLRNVQRVAPGIWPSYKVPIRGSPSASTTLASMSVRTRSHPMISQPARRVSAFCSLKISAAVNVSRCSIQCDGTRTPCQW